MISSFIKRNFGWNLGPLHKAARAGYIEVVKEHLAAGEDVNAKDGGLTPVHYAAGGGYTRKSSNCLSPKGRM